ncbi:MAG: molybdate ABC transporter substrate-binding protein [Actinomycetota bacterium]
MKRAVALLLGALVACSTAGAHTTTELTVAAAASLTVVLPRVVAAFERAHPGSHVVLSFGPSNGLAVQISSGAPVDVFASASPEWIDYVARDPGVGDRATFARNRIVVIVPRGDRVPITSFADLARPGVRLVIAAAGVPAGDAARAALAKAGLSHAVGNVVSNEQDVEGVVQKVVSGDADAGIVYATDVTPSVARRVRVIDVPAAADVEVRYEIAVVTGTQSPALARTFVEWVARDAQPMFRGAGFAPPS